VQNSAAVFAYLFRLSILCFLA